MVYCCQGIVRTAHPPVFLVSAPLLLHTVLVGLAVQYEGSSGPSD